MKKVKKYILALDQGTTSSKSAIFDHSVNLLSFSKRSISQIYPEKGWIENDPEEIWNTQYETILEVVQESRINFDQIVGIGIANQRETTIIWEKNTGKPIYNAISWLCRRTEKFCNQLEENKKLSTYIRENTGLKIDPYFSGTKLRWILDRVEGAKERAEMGELLFGTVDSWLIWKMTKGKLHMTDYTNASRTMLFNIRRLDWDQKILKALEIPKIMLPIVCSSSKIFAKVVLFPHQKKRIPISSVMGDQQSSLYGNLCFSFGSIKSTYGTGCFSLMSIEKKFFVPKNELLTTISCGPKGESYYALEGTVPFGGASVQWLKDRIGIICSTEDASIKLKQVNSSEGIYFVPDRFLSLSHSKIDSWNPFLKGSIVGITMHSNKLHIIRAILESISFQNMDVLEDMKKEIEKNKLYIKELKVDGNASSNDLLIQFQSDILGISVKRSKFKENSILGTALLSGITIGFWRDIQEIRKKVSKYETFLPSISSKDGYLKYSRWKKVSSILFDLKKIILEGKS
ncbi:FGGY family carbohydrate kinase [Candidatus Riesia pediculicola]|uniref:ATP:glycerol 3-phosphotransferase n=1 Tax=Riesia pediculicola (strain USDA) TaxID=515618 RepID=D4G8H3_RIEPU|nr:glycerol kinase GlpK [Candidatus Riesia pediculicola]ADD79652.1 glycerol kinase [Candidatus Riesia pediculicola USDA]ARC53855.1 glycerol kinase [Candidatus Riesia pediculicola]QOJ86486.1 glycerol kinase GlpK [Candidatus Riesia pediculicola]